MWVTSDDLEANLQAEFQLRDMLSGSEFSRPESVVTPLNPGWQPSAKGMHEIVRHILSDQPRLVVECGSGASSMCIGRALRPVCKGHLISLENSAEWVTIVTGLLQDEGLSNVDVRHAPIEPFQVTGNDQPWYSASALAGIEEIDFLLVDGPPGNTSKLATRRPSLPRQAASWRHRHAGRQPTA